jgi:hypothetical protein
MKIVENQQMIDELMNMLVHRLDHEAIPCQSWDKFVTYKRILLLRTAQDRTLQSFFDVYQSNESAKNKGAKFYVLSAIKDWEIFDKNDMEYEYVLIEDKFDPQEADNYKKMTNEWRYDAILFLNGKRHNSSYVNIEEIISKFLINEKIPVYSYGVGTGLIYFKNIVCHCSDLKFIGSVLHWIHEEIQHMSKEKENI